MSDLENHAQTFHFWVDPLLDFVSMDNYCLDEYKQEDKSALLEYLNNKNIYDNTLNIPYPYCDKDADFFLNLVAKETQEANRTSNWAIRRTDGKLVGGAGFNRLRLQDNPHKAEIGYWLAEPFWGRGIMTKIIGGLCAIGFDDFALVRVTAHVFESNARSARVLEKNGFKLEGVLQNYFKKNGVVFGAKLYAKTK